MSAICMIPARGGSTRIPFKNIKLFHGKPIIAYSIKTAFDSGLFDRVVVSTDSEEIAVISRGYGAEVSYRPERLAVNSVGTQEVAQWFVQQPSSVGKMCVIYPTAPMMTAKDLIVGRAQLDSGAMFAMSVGDDPLQDAGQWYWGRYLSFIKNLPLIAPYTRMIPIPKNRVCDINTEEDWEKAEKMYLNLKNGESVKW